MNLKKKNLRGRSALSLEAVKLILAEGFEKYGDDDYDLQEALSRIPAYQNIYADLGLKFVKLSKGMGKMYRLQIHDIPPCKEISSNDIKWLLKLAHDTLDVAAFAVLLISELTRLLKVDPKDLVNINFSERYSKPSELEQSVEKLDDVEGEVSPS